MTEKDKAPAVAAAPAGNATTPAVAPVVHVTIQQPDRNAEGARAMAEGRALNMDETVPGGRYRNASGQIVDANGDPIKSAKKDDEDA